ncbi:TonB-dependent receptor [Pontibacter chitinilyticus]|uniref:TonB-dependent receptor n=1 Tax=Pontibacter chitinilyticus TaxID=2674989 RepID=UPI0032192FED
MKTYQPACILLLLACLSVAVPAVAQQDSAWHQLKTVEIFGRPAEVFAVGSRVSQLDSSYRSTYNAASLAEALQARTPLYIKSYGASGVASVSFRGTSASQTAVLWNGLNINSPTLGQSDLSVLPLSGVGDVAVQYGSAAAMYGSGAIGGAILLSSPTYSGAGFSAALQQEAGSFGRYFSSGSVQYASDKLEVGASAYLWMAENNFKYHDFSRLGVPERRQEHAERQQYGFTQDLTWHLSHKTQLALHSWYTLADYQLQPAMGAAENNAQQKDENLRLMAELKHTSFWGQTDVKAAYFKDYLHYSDNASSSVADIGTYQVQAEQTYTRGSTWSLRSGLNLQHFVAENTGYTSPKTENRASLFALFRYDPLERLQLSLNLRQELAEGYDPQPAPAFGASWELLASANNRLYLKGNAAGSYRVPTLNDRFWLGAGNPDLKPEQGWNYEGGLRHVYTTGKLQVETEATAYYMLIDDWIQWSPDAAGTWRPFNLQKVRTTGLELSSSATATLGSTKLSGTGNYTYASSQQVVAYAGASGQGRQLMYVPLHKATLAATAAYKNWLLQSTLSYTGLRYTNNSETDWLNAFLLLDLALSKQLPLQQNTLILSLRADNVTGTEYQTMGRHAMPRRGYTVSLRFLIP